MKFWHQMLEYLQTNIKLSYQFGGLFLALILLILSIIFEAQVETIWNNKVAPILNQLYPISGWWIFVVAIFMFTTILFEFLRNKNRNSWGFLKDKATNKDSDFGGSITQADLFIAYRYAKREQDIGKNSDKVKKFLNLLANTTEQKIISQDAAEKMGLSLGFRMYRLDDGSVKFLRLKGGQK